MSHEAEHSLRLFSETVLHWALITACASAAFAMLMWGLFLAQELWKERVWRR